MKPFISIIVPIYNVEKYLDKCLFSIRNQSLKEIEIICIDDCSPDKSAKIVEKHQKEDSRIKLLRHDKNKGLGGARNTGILAAQADYIAGVDSDDTIHPDMMRQLWENTQEGKFDIVCCGFDRVDEKGKVLSSAIFSATEVTNENNSINIFTLFYPSFWNKIWRRSLFIDNNIFFPEHLYFEDLATTPKILTKAKHIKIIEVSLYKYLQRNDAITATYTDKHIVDFFKVFAIIRNHLIEYNLYNQYEASFLLMVDNSMFWYSNKLIESGMADKFIDQHLRHLLMLKVSYLENITLVEDKTNDELLSLIKSAHTTEDVKNNSRGSKVAIHSKLGSTELVPIQKLGCWLFSIVFRPFIKPNHLSKLKLSPVAFFQDSKNQFTIIIGKLLRIT